MSKVKYCWNCGASVEESEKFCPECGAKLDADDSPQPAAMREPSQGEAYTGTPRGVDKKALDHLTTGFSVAMEQPMVFLPPIISGILGFLVGYTLSNFYLGDFLSTVIGLSSSIISFILNFASIDMSRDAYYKQPLDLGQSIGYVLGRFLIFLVAAIFGGILSITIILIPVVLFMFVIMVMDETGIIDALKKAFSVIGADLADVLIIIVVSIIASFVISYVPYVSTLLNAAVNVIIGLAFIDIYATYKAK